MNNIHTNISEFKAHNNITIYKEEKKTNKDKDKNKNYEEWRESQISSIGKTK